MVLVVISVMTDNMLSNTKDSSVHGYVLHWCRDALEVSQHKTSHTTGFFFFYTGDLQTNFALRTMHASDPQGMASLNMTADQQR